MTKKREDTRKYADCVNAIAFDYFTKLTTKKVLKKRYTRGFLKHLIEQKNENLGIIGDISVKIIKSSTRTGNLDPKNRGVKSPLADAKETLVMLCVQMGKIHQPLNGMEGIAPSPMQDALKDSKSAIRLGSDIFKVGEAGKGWW